MARLTLSAAFGAALTAFTSLPSPASADDAQIARGRYLVTLAGCSDCHTPGALLGSPDMKRYLGGSDVGFEIPGAGIFVGQNLTPDKETGIGSWSSDQIVTAIRTGKTPDGRDLSPVMPGPLSRISPTRTRRRSRPSSRAFRRSTTRTPARLALRKRRRSSSPSPCRPTPTMQCRRRINSGGVRHFGRNSSPTPLFTNWRE